MSLTICMVGDFSPNLDEGYKNTSHYLARHLEKRHRVVRLNAKRVNTRAFWRDFMRSKTDIIHTIAQPTDASLLVTRLMRALKPGARTVVSALKAESYFSGSGAKQRLILQAARPDLMLTQTIAAKQQFRKERCRVVGLPNGVDLDRFRPATREEKQALWVKYGVDPERPVALHVGHLHEARNLGALEALLHRGIQVVVAGSLYMGTNTDLIERLEGAGFRLLKGYVPQIEELYKLADCYVFPTMPGDSITTPLSVLEAMGCNLPVVTTRFPGLTQAFSPSNGLHFIESADKLPSVVSRALREADKCNTRQMVSAMSWQAVADKLESYYKKLLSTQHGR